MLFAFALLLSSAIVTFGSQESLQLVQLVFRHGDRSPMESLPTNTVPESAWLQGYGTITMKGKMRQYELGQYIRERYGGFINPSFSNFETKVRSTNKDRTLMSAEAFLAGLYPFTFIQEWQPIPIHTVAASEDNLLSIDAECPRADEIFEDMMNSPEVQAFGRQNQPLFDYLSEKSGRRINLVNFFRLFDTLFSQSWHNFTNPTWADEAIMKKLKIIEDYEFPLRFYTQEAVRLRGGPLLKEMTQNMVNRMNGSLDARAKLFIYSSHDDMMSAFLSALGAYNLRDGQKPPYSATFILELHRNLDGLYHVELFYKNSTTDPTEIHDIVIKGCTQQCPLSQFRALTQESIPIDWESECGLTQDTSLIAVRDYTVILTLSILCGVFIILTILLSIPRAFQVLKSKTEEKQRLRQENSHYT